MINIFKSLIISVTVLLIAVNIPANLLSFDHWSDSKFGTSVTTLDGSENLSDFPTTYNANLNALNAGKMEISTTTLPLLTTLANLSTVGTIGTGVWQGTDIGVAYGGTGTSSPETNYVMLGNGSSGLKVVAGFGSSGQFLTSNGAGSAPTWQTSSVNQGDDYTWTGTHNFTSTSTFSATTTLDSMTIGHTVSPMTASTTLTGLTLPQPVYIATSTDAEAGGVLLADANDQDALDFVGFAVTNASSGETVYVQTDGIVDGFSSLTKGADYYVQDAVGTIGTSVGTYEVMVGTAISDTEVLMRERDWEYCGTATNTDSSSPYTPSVSVPDCARFAVVDIFADDEGVGNADTKGQFTLFKVGKTSSAYNEVFDQTGDQGCSGSWSGNTITASCSATTAESFTITAHYYK